MKIEIAGQKKLLSNFLKEYCARRCQFAFDRFATKLRRVQLFLTDENGPKKGTDKRCKVLISDHEGKTYVIEETGTDPYSTADSVLSKAKACLSKALAKRRHPRLAIDL